VRFIKAVDSADLLRLPWHRLRVTPSDYPIGSPRSTPTPPPQSYPHLDHKNTKRARLGPRGSGLTDFARSGTIIRSPIRHLGDVLMFSGYEDRASWALARRQHWCMMPVCPHLKIVPPWLLDRPLLWGHSTFRWARNSSDTAFLRIRMSAIESAFATTIVSQERDKTPQSSASTGGTNTPIRCEPQDIMAKKTSALKKWTSRSAVQDK
jgi:hypothetical protein